MSDQKQPKLLWFRAKAYGWGWTPSTWEGWVLTLGFIAIIVMGTFLAEANPTTPFARIFFPFSILLVMVLIFTCYATGEKPEWRWGGKPLFKKK